MSSLFPDGSLIHYFEFSRARYQYDLFESRSSLMIPESSTSILHVGDFAVIKMFDRFGLGYTGQFSVCRVSSIFNLDDGFENSLVGWEVLFSC